MALRSDLQHGRSLQSWRRLVARSRLDAVKNLSGFDGLTATPGGKPAKRKIILTPAKESKKKEKEAQAAERRKKAMNGRMKHLA